MTLKTDFSDGDWWYADDANDTNAAVNSLAARPALWTWDGTGTWTPPAAALPGDLVWNTDTGDVTPIEEA